MHATFLSHSFLCAFHPPRCLGELCSVCLFVCFTIKECNRELS